MAGVSGLTAREILESRPEPRIDTNITADLAYAIRDGQEWDRAHARAMRAALLAVLDQHQQETDGDESYCCTCGLWPEKGQWTNWPCGTVQAINTALGSVE